MKNKYRFYQDEEAYVMPDYRKLMKYLKVGKERTDFFRDIVVFYNAQKTLDKFEELGLVKSKGKDEIVEEHIMLVERLIKDFPEIKKHIEKGL